MLKWEELAGGYAAKSNGRTVGIVTARFDGVVVWEITAVHMKWVGKGYGEAKSIASAKAALTRGWSKWKSAYGLA